MNSEAVQVAKDTVVSFHYTLKNKDGEVLDTSTDSEPLTYLHGHDQIVPGLERALNTKVVGDKMDVHVPALQGYGEHQKELIMTLPKSQGKLPDGVGVGNMLELRSQDGQRIPAKILEITPSDIVVDANHPLAGQDLFFSVEITEIRRATEQEMTHGHAHGAGGHNH